VYDASTDQVQGQALGHPAVPLPGVRRQVRLGEDGFGVALGQQGVEFFPRIAMANDQTAASGMQALIQSAQAAQQEGYPFRPNIRRIQQCRIQYKDGNHAVGVGQGRGQSLVVRQTQVPADPP
jgi:hypothetical protein